MQGAFDPSAQYGQAAFAQQFGGLYSQASPAAYGNFVPMGTPANWMRSPPAPAYASPTMQLAGVPFMTDAGNAPVSAPIASKFVPRAGAAAFAPASASAGAAGADGGQRMEVYDGDVRSQIFFPLSAAFTTTGLLAGAANRAIKLKVCASFSRNGSCRGGDQCQDVHLEHGFHAAEQQRIRDWLDLKERDFNASPEAVYKVFYADLKEVIQIPRHALEFTRGLFLDPGEREKKPLAGASERGLANAHTHMLQQQQQQQQQLHKTGGSSVAQQAPTACGLYSRQPSRCKWGRWCNQAHVDGSWIENHRSEFESWSRGLQQRFEDLTSATTFLVHDPQLRAVVQMPKSAVGEFTRGLMQHTPDKSPSICLLQQQGRCTAGMRCNQVHAHPDWLRQCRERPGEYIVSASPHAGAAAGAAGAAAGAPAASGGRGPHDGGSDFGFALGPQQQPPPPFHQQHHTQPGAIGSQPQGGAGGFVSWHVGDTSPIDAHAPPPPAGASVGGAASYIPQQQQQQQQQQQRPGHLQMHPSAVGQPSLENSVSSPTMLVRSPPKKPSGLALALSPKLAAVPPAATPITESASPGVAVTSGAAQAGDGQTPTPQSPTIITSATGPGGVNTPGTAPVVRKTRASPTHQPYASAPGFSNTAPSMDSPTFSAFLPGAHRSTRTTAMGLQLAPGFPTFNPNDSCDALPPPAAGDASLTSPTAIPTHHASTPSRGMRPRTVHSAAAAAAAQALQHQQQQQQQYMGQQYGAPTSAPSHGAYGGAGSYPQQQQQQQQFGGYSHQPYGTGSGLLGTEPNTPLVTASPSRQHPPPLTSFAEDPSHSREFGSRRMPPTPGVFAGGRGASVTGGGGLVSPSAGMSFNVPPGGILPSPVMGAHFSFSGIDDPLLPPPWAAAGNKGPGVGTPTHPPAPAK